MPGRTDTTTARIELLVGIDKQSYNETRNTIRDMFAGAGELSLSQQDLQRYGERVRKTLSTAGSEFARDFSAEFDKNIADTLKRIQDIQKTRLDVVGGTGDLAGIIEAYKIEGAKTSDEILEALAEQESAAKAWLEGLDKRVEAAKRLKTEFGLNVGTVRKAGGALGEGFADFLDNMKSGDVQGLGKSIFGSLTGAVKKGAEKEGAAAAAASTEAAATALSASASSLAIAASTLAIAGGALVAIVGVMVAADNAAKDLNKTMLEGASIADIAYGSTGVTGTLGAAREAAEDLAFEFRGSFDEFAGIIADINQAGFSYREMGDAAKEGATQTEAIASAAQQAFMWSKSMGITVSEVAETMDQFSRQFGSSLEDMADKFGVIQGLAMQGGFNVKRFFTAVTQASSGMAIYNMRMDEAAQLLAKTQKILGDTDASDFIRSLTQGFTDESVTDRIKRLMIAGGSDSKRIFEGNAKRAVKAFSETFASGAGSAKIDAAFELVTGKKYDPNTLMTDWSQMDASTRRAILHQLRQNGDEQSQAAARQLDTLSQSLDAQKGGLGDQVRGLAALDMQAKLAYRLQSLGDTRLNEMSAVELAAYEQYAGIGGAQLEQLMRVEEELYAGYEVYAKGAGKTAKTWEAWLATDESALSVLTDTKEVQDEAKYFARETVENTRSVFTVLQNTIAALLNDIHGILTMIFGQDRDLDASQAQAQQDALTEVRAQREAATAEAENLIGAISALEDTLATTAPGSKAHTDALAQLGDLKEKKARVDAQRGLAGEQERTILTMGKSMLSGDVVGKAMNQIVSSGRDVDVLSRYFSPEMLGMYENAKGDLTQQVQSYDEVATGAFGGRSMGQTTTEVVADTAAQTALLDDMFRWSETSDGEILDVLTKGGPIDKDGLKFTKRMMMDNQDFQEAFPKESKEASFEALKLFEGWRIAQALEIDDPAMAAQEYAAGGSLMIARAMMAKGMDPNSLFADALPPAANDFISRPGQPIQRFAAGDVLTAFDPQAAAAKGMSSGGSGTVNIYVNGGDPGTVFRTVKSALKNSGLRP